MELEGLKRGLVQLQHANIKAVSLVTDRHVMVKKYMKDEQPGITHYFDVWHMAKGVSKKLEALSKKKEADAIHPWVKSISSHLYWVAMTSGNDGELKTAKWKSAINHITDKHEGHSEKFPACEHGPLEYREYLVEGERPYKMVKKVIESPFLLRDIPKLSPLHQTLGLEVFHSVVNHFAPKSTHFHYPAMTARLYIAALHFNENSNKPLAVTKDGNKKWQICYPKAKKGTEAVVKPQDTPTFDYVTVLKKAVIERRRLHPSYKAAYAESENLLHAPAPNNINFHPVQKE